MEARSTQMRACSTQMPARSIQVRGAEQTESREARAQQHTEGLGGGDTQMRRAQQIAAHRFGRTAYSSACAADRSRGHATHRVERAACTG
eukprot:6053486-Pleurochrysis_carterae.AAC.1